MIFAGILAGGVGSRMNIADMPKQFLDLGNKPIVIHTLEKFLLCERVDEIYIGVHPSWVSHMEALVVKYITHQRDKIHIVEGGTDRNSTIMNIVDMIEKEYGQSKEHYIITHDSVRPFVSSRIIEENIDAVIKYKACDTVVSATDTIVVSEDALKIADIPVRSKMYQGQTPQSFQITLLKTLYEDLSDEEKEILTDACKIALVRNQDVYLVKGEVSNMKLTTITDYNIAQAMVGGNLID